tara:strand:+ start:561 stop:1226 length:666 start_codon:yes stop_codon:yes gene_type:complete
MEAIPILVQNKESIKVFFGAIVLLICLIITLKSDRLFKLSSHQGIRHFRNAFFFYGLAFLSRYIIGSYYNPYSLSIIFFEFFLIVGGFFLLHSLLWRRFRHIERGYTSSLLSPITFVFYIMAIVLVLLDLTWRAYFFMFLSQMIIFLAASIISYNNFRKKPRKFFPKFYFVAMLLSLVAWILNALAALILNWNKGVLSGVYLINIVVFLLFWIGIMKVTKQ